MANKGGKKYRFRLMYFICEDNKLIAHNVHAANAHQFKDIAERICSEKNGRGVMMWEDQSKPVPVSKVHGFYLVHESLFEEILKEWSKD